MLIIFGLVLVLIFKPRRHLGVVVGDPPPPASITAAGAEADETDMLPPLPMITVDLTGLGSGLGNGKEGSLLRLRGRARMRIV